METFMDEVEVHSEKGKGTVVIMRKKFASLAKGQGVSGNEG
jgi:anti-sigma regulatory factor (Ser/Thr protein kinase)